MKLTSQLCPNCYKEFRGHYRTRRRQASIDHVCPRCKRCWRYKVRDKPIDEEDKKEPNLTDIDREDILRKAYQYLKHPDEFVKILAQITIYHYGD